MTVGLGNSAETNKCMLGTSCTEPPLLYDTLQAPTVHPYKHQEVVAFTAYTSNKQKTALDAPKNIVLYTPTPPKGAYLTYKTTSSLIRL